MKYRNGFVSNSSSSSFILFKTYLTKEQIDHIKNWQTFAVSDEYKKMLEEYAKTHEIEEHYTEAYDGTKEEPFTFIDFPYYPEGWYVEETYDLFNIDTTMDNFNMEQFLAVIGVDINKMGLRLEDHHNCVIGRNDALTDIKEYVTDPHFFDNFEEDYWLTSEYYKNKIYPMEAEFASRSFEGDWPRPKEPKIKKKWICEDAGNALNDVAKKIKDIAIKNGVYFFEKLPSGNYIDDKTRLYMEILEVVDEVKDNWKAADEFDDFVPEDDASQGVVAALEGEGCLSEEEEKKYNEALNKLYKPIGVNINNF